MEPVLSSARRPKHLLYKRQRFAGANFTAGAVFGRKLYDGRSQPLVVDLGKSATRLGKACMSGPSRIGLSRISLGSRALRLGIAGRSERVRATNEFQTKEVTLATAFSEK